jgi:methanethiol S-methyltransferase
LSEEKMHRTRSELRAVFGSSVRVSALCLQFALLHSLLASKPFKHGVRRIIGARHYYGVYRMFYSGQSVIHFAVTVWAFSRLPDRTIYRVPPPLSHAMTAVQIGSWGVLFASLHSVSFWRTAGFSQLADYLRGDVLIRDVEAQGPDPASGDMLDRGLYRIVRHPANASAFGMFLFWHRMTVNRAVAAFWAVLYVFLGSLHEEIRLHARYGEAYERYRQRVPFLIPGLRMRRNAVKKIRKTGDETILDGDSRRAGLRYGGNADRITASAEVESSGH